MIRRRSLISIIVVLFDYYNNEDGPSRYSHHATQKFQFHGLYLIYVFLFHCSRFPSIYYIPLPAQSFHNCFFYILGVALLLLDKKVRFAVFSYLLPQGTFNIYRRHLNASFSCPFLTFQFHCHVTITFVCTQLLFHIFRK